MLLLEDIHHAYQSQPVLHGINLQVAEGEIACLLGPSGCGKTTLLRIVAGLEDQYEGRVLLNGEDLRARPAHQRGLGLMFQNFALFPHMNVAENVAFGLRMKHMPAAAIREQVRLTLDRVGLRGYADRDVVQLSGGERQRVALARSLAPQPRLLMLDEPLGSLDAALRNRLVSELRDIIKSVGLTAVYVTHDQQEAYAIADRIAIMNVGHVEQVGRPVELYRQPASPFVARFLGLHNVLPIITDEGGRCITVLDGVHVPSPVDAVLLHPDGIRLSSQDGGTVRAVVSECVFQGSAYRIIARVVAAPDVTLLLRVPALNNSPPAVGHMVWLDVDAAQVIPLMDWPGSQTV